MAASRGSKQVESLVDSKDSACLQRQAGPAAAPPPWTWGHVRAVQLGGACHLPSNLQTVFVTQRRWLACPEVGRSAFAFPWASGLETGNLLWGPGGGVPTGYPCPVGTAGGGGAQAVESRIQKQRLESAPS